MTAEVIEGSARDVTPPDGGAMVVRQTQVQTFDRPVQDPLRALGRMEETEFRSEMAAIKAGRDRMLILQRDLLRPTIDYDTIPGTARPTLLQPGAEQLCMYHRLIPRHEQQTIITPVPGHPDRIDVHTRTFLHLGSLDGPVVGTAVASCSSYEERYRWRTKERACPTCGAPAIIKGKAEYAPRSGGRTGAVLPGYDKGGWVCWKNKKDTPGCGANFTDDDPRITGVTPGKVENDEPYGQLNTIVQISAKRGLVGATRHTLGITDLFTQDVEDMTPAQREEAAATGPTGDPGPSAPDAAPSPPAARARPETAADATPTSAAAPGALVFEGPVMATPDGIRSTNKGRVLAFAIKVRNSKHNVELWDAMADAAVGYAVEGMVLRVEGVRTEEDWPGRGDKPKKKVIADVTIVAVVDQAGTRVIAQRAPSGPQPLPDRMTGGTASAGPASSAGAPGPSTAMTDAPIRGEGGADMVGIIRAIRWEKTARGVMFLYLEVVGDDGWYRVAMASEDAFATIADEATGSLSVGEGMRVRIMGGWNPAGTMIVAGIVMEVEKVEQVHADDPFGEMGDPRAVPVVS